MSTLVLHHPDVVVMEVDQETGRVHVFVGIENPKAILAEADVRRNVYEFKGWVQGRLDDLPPRLRRHWQPTQQQGED